MTRAKNAMTIICRPPAKTSERCYVSDFVREAMPEPIGDPLWYEKVGDGRVHLVEAVERNLQVAEEGVFGERRGAG